MCCGETPDPVDPSPKFQLYEAIDPSLSLDALASNDAANDCVENVNAAAGGLFGTDPPRPLTA